MEAFKQAYRAFQSIRAAATANPDWREKYEAFQLGGQQCLRYYQLESAFGKEYLGNPDFKAFVEREDPNTAASLIRRGFRGSRRAINLAKRMETHCPDQKQQADQKDKLLRDLDELAAAAEKIQSTLKDLERETAQLKEESADLEKAAEQAQREVAEARQKESELANKATQLEELPDQQELDERLSVCADQLKQLANKFAPIDQTQARLQEKVEKVKGWPGRLLGKLGEVKLFQGKVKDKATGIPAAERAIDKLAILSEKANAVGSILEVLTGKETRLQTQVAAIGGRIDQARAIYDRRDATLAELQEEALSLIIQKTGLQEKYARANGTIAALQAEVDAVLVKFSRFADKSDCIDLDDLRDKLAEIAQKQAETEPVAEEVATDLAKAEQETATLQQETEQVAEEVEKTAELARERETLSDQFGKDVTIEPVQPEQWAESFEVKRDYWEAVFHPDDEVVEGYRGRYFQVRLRDADKKVKLLFGPGEYYMDRSDFRDNYGAVIGAFVTEALHALRQTERGEIKLFVQGSADITGQTTFRGNLDGEFKYDRMTVLPREGDSERFLPTPRERTIPERGFTNEDLPNLRGNFLREMISIYSRRLEPILLEGTVTDVVDKEDRNAVIYLFIPETLVEAYSRY